MAIHPLVPPVAAALLAILCGLAAIALSQGRRARWLVPVSGVLLAAVAVFGLIPELGVAIGWIRTLALAGLGYAVLAWLDHSGFPVCPSCSHGERFTTSLVLATAVHAFVDGWGMAATGKDARVGVAIGMAIFLHKIPEGLALGTMLRVSTAQAGTAALLLCLAELPTVAGGFTGIHGAPGIWVNYPLAAVSGTFLFLGLHAALPFANKTAARK
jgi:zinc transporter ZupT